MRQHTVTEGDNRKYWGNLREQARRKARKDIRLRVLTGSEQAPPEESTTPPSPGIPPATTTATTTTTTIKTKQCNSDEHSNNNKHSIPSLILRVVKDDRSYFSLQSVNAIGASYLETPVSSQYLLAQPSSAEMSNTCSIDPSAMEQQQQQQQPAYILAHHEQFVSWFGPEGCKDFELYATRFLTSFTLLELAVWTQRYYIVGALIHGGVNPCIRALPTAATTTTTPAESTSSDVVLSELKQLGSSLVLPRFFQGVPLSLSSYVVKRVVDMRRLSHEYQQEQQRLRYSTTSDPLGQQGDTNSNNKEDESCLRFFDCDICQKKQLPMSVQLRFGGKNDGHNGIHHHHHCSHFFCELCLWKDLVAHLEERMEDVVECPLCCQKEEAAQEEVSVVAASAPFTESSSTSSSIPLLLSSSLSSSSLSAVERRLESQNKFQSLPADAAELKAVSTSRKRKKKSAAIASNWSDAVRPRLGQTQDVRRDKFWLNLELGSFHYVRMCLEMGVNLLEQNQYGQTPLYLAAWRGDVALLRLLLNYYAKNDKDDVELIMTPANGGMTAIGTAKANHHTDIVQLLQEHTMGVADGMENDYSFSHAPLLESLCTTAACPKLEILLDPQFNHPGAGSYVIDDCITPPSVDALCHLWTILPSEVAVKKKKSNDIPCSTRRYFCDAEKQISSLIMDALEQFFAKDECSILPHMRYLCYSEDGAELAPHVDLPRVDPFTKERSTHTFLLYLTDCNVGGATTLLLGMTGSECNDVLSRVQPKRARLLLFPHDCPHAGERVVDVPKLLIRGEARLSTLLFGA